MAGGAVFGVVAGALVLAVVTVAQGAFKRVRAR